MRARIARPRDPGLPLVFALVVLAGCSGEKQRLTFCGGNLAFAPLEADMLPSDPSKFPVDFGSVPISQNRVETPQLSDVDLADPADPLGPCSVTILKVSQDTPSAEFSVDVTPGQVLVAGGPAVPIPLHFVPFTAGPKAATVTLTTDSTTVPYVELDLTGIGINK